MPDTPDHRSWSRRLIPGDGVSLHIVTAGESRDAHHPVLFLHGFPEFWYAWKDPMRDLGRDRPAAALDMRGYGHSDKPTAINAYTLPHLVADVGIVLDHLSPARPAALVAHDWGGVVAWQFAALFPERLSKLVIINAPHPAVFARELLNNPAQRRASAYVALFRSPLAPALLRAGRFALLRRAVFGGAAPGAFSLADRRRYVSAWSQAGALTGGLNYYRAARFDPALASRPVTVPTLVLWGERDTALLPGNLDGLHDYVPDLTVRRFPAGSHWLVHEQPDAVSAALRAFLAS